MLVNQKAISIFTKPVNHKSMEQRVSRSKSLLFYGEKNLWSSISKVMLVVFPFVLMVVMWVSSSISQIGESIESMEMNKNSLAVKNLKLKANKAKLFSHDQIQISAGNQLALYVPEKIQIIPL